MLIVNNLEFDHADIFGDLDAIKLIFRRLINIVPQNGMIVLNGDDMNCVEVTRIPRARGRGRFFQKLRSTVRDVSYSAKKSRFCFGREEFDIPMVGEFNVRNAPWRSPPPNFIACRPKAIRAALTRFKGVADARKSAAKRAG